MTGAISRPNLRRMRGDQGISMVEMMVAIFLTLIVLGVTSMTMVLGLRGSRTSMVRTQNTQDANIILDRMSKPLRMAIRPLANPPTAPFLTGGTPTTGTSTDVTFYAAINTMTSGCVVSGPTKYRLYLDSTTGNLIEQITPAKATGTTYDWPASTTVTYTIGTGLTKTQSIFTYYDKNNADLGTLDAADAFSVDSVGLRLSVDKPTTPDLPSTVVVNKVNLPNSSGTFVPPSC